jgi:hypothetical protein
MRQRGQRKSHHSGEIAGLLSVEAAGIEPTTRRKQNPKQVALLPAKEAGKNNFSTFKFDFSSLVMSFLGPWEKVCSSTLRGTLRAGGSILSFQHHSL